MACVMGMPGEILDLELVMAAHVFLGAERADAKLEADA